MVLVENYSGHHQNWAKRFNDPTKSDVVFEAKDGQTFHCEKIVLEVASPYFERLFSNCKDSTKYVSAKDLDPEALKWILRSCYTADGDLNDGNVISVMVAAKTYEISWVSTACLKYFKGDKSEPMATFQYSKDMEKWQEWRVPRSGWFHIVAMGAKAADQTKANAQLYKGKGGEGAIIGGSFELEADAVVQILTGGMSRMWTTSKSSNTYTGGGGGTFVALKEKEATLLLAAGGGGGINGRSYGADANLGEDGIGSDAKYLGGKNGGNGASYEVYHGGLGWKAGPVALAKPREKARIANPNETGGFGGGGDICGGGGGYSGGSAGYYVGGGGGGSYVSSNVSNSWKRIGNSGHGKVLIWSGKDVPPSVVDRFGILGEGADAQSNGEAIHSWEILD